jgi:hypothetical protein
MVMVEVSRVMAVAVRLAASTPVMATMRVVPESLGAL